MESGFGMDSRMKSKQEEGPSGSTTGGCSGNLLPRSVDDNGCRGQASQTRLEPKPEAAKEDLEEVTFTFEPDWGEGPVEGETYKRGELRAEQKRNGDPTEARV